MSLAYPFYKAGLADSYYIISKYNFYNLPWVNGKKYLHLQLQQLAQYLSCPFVEADENV
jgi:hypothetical protein